MAQFFLYSSLNLLFWGTVIQAQGKEGEIPKVVERWGEPDYSKSVLAASLVDRKFDPVCIVLPLFKPFIVIFFSFYKFLCGCSCYLSVLILFVIVMDLCLIIELGSDVLS